MKKISQENIRKMNTKTVWELRSIAKDKGLHGYYKLKKADLVALLLEQSAEEMPTPAPRSKGKERRPAAPVKIIPSPQEIKNTTSKAFSKVKNSMLRLHDNAKKTLKDYAEGEAKKENQEEEERTLKETYRSFMMTGKPKTDADSYFDQAKPHIKTLIENQLKEMGSAKIIMTLWVL